MGRRRGALPREGDAGDSGIGVNGESINVEVVDSMNASLADNLIRMSCGVCGVLSSGLISTESDGEGGGEDNGDSEKGIVGDGGDCSVIVVRAVTVVAEGGAWHLSLEDLRRTIRGVLALSSGERRW